MTSSSLLERIALLTLALVLVDGRMAAATDCEQKHYGPAERLHRSVKDGDVAILKGIAGHVVRNSVQHYAIEDLVTPEDMTRAARGMEYFLKWKLGSPTLVTGQWVTAGYGHFERSYRDEAGGMLLGVFELSREEPELKLPEFLLDWVQEKVGESDALIVHFLTSRGIPLALAKPLAAKAEKALQHLVERNRVGLFVPKSFDLPNEIVETAIEALRAPPASRHLPDGRSGRGSGAVSTRGPAGTKKSGIENRLPPDGASAEGPLSTGGAPEATRPSLPADGVAVEDRIAALEARVARLEGLLEAAVGLLERQVARPELADAGGGYENLVMTVWTGGDGRCRVVVNDMLVGVFDVKSSFDLAPFLEPGKRNSFGFEFELNEGGNPGYLELVLDGRLPGSEKDVRFYKFKGTEERLEDAIEIPIAPRS